MATPFDPEAYAKKRLQEDQPSAQPFDPEAYALKRLSEDPPSQEPENPLKGLQPAGEYRGQSLLGKPNKEGAYAIPAIRKQAIDTFMDRGGQERNLSDLITGPQSDDSAPRPDRSITENINAHFSPQSIKQSNQRAKETIGDALYKASNIGGLAPKAIGTLDALTDNSGGDFASRVNKNRAIEGEVANLREERSPIASKLGNIARDVGLYSTGAGLLSKVPGIGAGGAGTLGEFAKLITRGAVTNYGVGKADNSDSPFMDATLGAAGEAVPAIIGGGVKKFGDILTKLRASNEAGTLPEQVLHATDSIPFYGKIQKGLRTDAEKSAQQTFESNKQGVLNQIDDLKGQQAISSAQNAEKLNDLRDLGTQATSDAKNAYDYNKTAARNQLRDLSEAEPAELGGRFLERIKGSKQKLSNEYGEISDKLMSQHGDTPAQVDGLRNEIKDTLNKNELLDAKGNVDLAKMDLIQSPDRKAMVQRLANMLDALKINPTIKGLNALKQDLQSLANYGAPVRTAEQGVFGRLADKAKGSLDDALEQASGSGAQEFKNVRQKYAQQKPILDSLSKTATRLPERLVVNARVQFPKSKVQEILKTNPEFKQDIGDFVFEHITQTPASQNTIRKTMDYYGRDFLKDLVGEKRFNLLNQAEDSLTQASSKFNPKNFPNEEVQRRIGGMVDPNEMGPYSFDSAKKSIANQEASSANQFTANKNELQKQLLNKFEYKDPQIPKIQELLTKILGNSKSPNNAESIGDWIKRTPRITTPILRQLTQ